jgi:hypothetical protein
MTKTILLPSRCVFEDFRAGDVGRHQVGSELDSLKFQMKDLGDRFHQQRFGQPGAPVIKQWPPKTEQ